ncbi:flagellar basal body rod protein FlgB [Sporichthya brevicatena]|uniref:Flagellar basal body rod protein FlgB n=1 Tax=Sporichthya brevicatena TaxID=171442 RepID=A0ABN1GE72_9ACTN
MFDAIGLTSGNVAMYAITSALDGLAARQRAIADNVANINTPGFLAGKVQFEDALASAVATGDTSGGPTWSIARSLEPTRTDGNNVNLDRETLLNVDTGLRYSLMLRAADHEFGILRASMRAV